VKTWRSLITVLSLLPCLCRAQSPAKVAEPRLTGAQVTVPWDDFKHYLGKTQADAESAKPPVDSAVSRATYTGRVEGETAKFDVVMQIAVLKSTGWTMVPIATAKLAIDQITVDGKAAKVSTAGDWHSQMAKALDAQAELAKQAEAVNLERGLLPVKVEVPRVGQLMKFEKLLVSPADELTIELDYKLPAEAAKQ